MVGEAETELAHQTLGLRDIKPVIPLAAGKEFGCSTAEVELRGRTVPLVRVEHREIGRIDRRVTILHYCSLLPLPASGRAPTSRSVSVEKCSLCLGQCQVHSRNPIEIDWRSMGRGLLIAARNSYVNRAEGILHRPLSTAPGGGPLPNGRRGAASSPKERSTQHEWISNPRDSILTRSLRRSENQEDNHARRGRRSHPRPRLSGTRECLATSAVGWGGAAGTDAGCRAIRWKAARLPPPSWEDAKAQGSRVRKTAGTSFSSDCEDPPKSQTRLCPLGWAPFHQPHLLPSASWPLSRSWRGEE